MQREIKAHKILTMRSRWLARLAVLRWPSCSSDDDIRVMILSTAFTLEDSTAKNFSVSSPKHDEWGKNPTKGSRGPDPRLASREGEVWLFSWSGNDHVSRAPLFPLPNPYDGWGGSFSPEEEWSPLAGSWMDRAVTAIVSQKTPCALLGGRTLHERQVEPSSEGSSTDQPEK